MSITLTNGTITFADGTVLSSANIPYWTVSGLPTKLSQFTNDLTTPADAIVGVTTSAIGGTGNPRLTLGVDSNNNLTLSITLQNCYCNC